MRCDRCGADEGTVRHGGVLCRRCAEGWHEVIAIVQGIGAPTAARGAKTAVGSVGSRALRVPADPFR